MSKSSVPSFASRETEHEPRGIPASSCARTRLTEEPLLKRTLKVLVAPFRSNLVFFVGDLSNLGDALIAQAELGYAKRTLGARRIWVAVPTSPSQLLREEFARLGADVIVVNTQLKMLLSACSTSDVFFGGGQVMRDSLTGKWLLVMLAAVATCRASGGQVHLVGAGAAHVKTRAKRLLWNFILTQCRSIGMRDEASASLVQNSFPGAGGRARLTADVAFLLQRFELPLPAAGSRYCVLSPAYDPCEGRTWDPRALAPFLRELHEADLFDEIVIVPHDLRPNMDLMHCEELHQYLRDTAGLPCRMARCQDLRSFAEVYRGCALVITARLHGLILGALAVRPVVGIDATGKLAPFASLFAYSVVQADGGPETQAQELVAGIRAFSRDACRARLSTLRDAAALNFVSP